MAETSRVEAHTAASHAPEIDAARACTPDRLLRAGRTAEIYRLPDGRILKRFLSGVPLDRIETEAHTGCYVEEMGLPVPRIYGRVRCQDGEGIIYEKLEGRSLLDTLAARPWTVVKYARLMGGLHVRIHALAAPAHLENQREWATGRIRETNKFPVRIRDGVLRLLDELPGGDRLCHGDFHPGNILLTRGGPIIIDWINACKGSAEGDVARTSVILAAALPPEGTPLRSLLERIRRLFLSTYLKTYSALSPLNMVLYSGWRAIMAANLLSDAPHPQEEPSLLRIVELGLRGPGVKA